MTLAAIRERLASRRTQLRAIEVAVLCGGGGAEREISLTSGANVARALAHAGFNVLFLPISIDWLSVDRKVLDAANRKLFGLEDADGALLPALPDSDSAIMPLRASGMVFTTMHGKRGEDGVWQGLLELLDLPYVSADVKGSALAFDKVASKRIFSQLGVATPEYCVLRRGDDPAAGIPPKFKKIVVKPVEQGSSVDVLMTVNDSNGHAEITTLLKKYEKLLIEQRIEGRELTCGVIGHNDDPLALPLVEIVPSKEFYDFDAKYSSGGSDYLCPAALPQEMTELIQRQSKLLYREMELEPYARFDCMLEDYGEPQFLEVNTLPGFTQFSLLPKAAQTAGIEFSELVEILMLLALERWEAKR